MIVTAVAAALVGVLTPTSVACAQDEGAVAARPDVVTESESGTESESVPEVAPGAVPEVAPSISAEPGVEQGVEPAVEPAVVVPEQESVALPAGVLVGPPEKVGDPLRSDEGGGQPGGGAPGLPGDEAGEPELPDGDVPVLPDDGLPGPPGADDGPMPTSVPVPRVRVLETAGATMYVLPRTTGVGWFVDGRPAAEVAEVTEEGWALVVSTDATTPGRPGVVTAVAEEGFVLLLADGSTRAVVTVLDLSVSVVPGPDEDGAEDGAADAAHGPEAEVGLQPGSAADDETDGRRPAAVRQGERRTPDRVERGPVVRGGHVEVVHGGGDEDDDGAGPGRHRSAGAVGRALPGPVLDPAALVGTTSVLGAEPRATSGRPQAAEDTPRSVTLDPLTLVVVGAVLAAVVALRGRRDQLA